MILPTSRAHFPFPKSLAAAALICALLVPSHHAGAQERAKPKDPPAGQPFAVPVPYDPLGPIPSPLDQKMVRLTYEPNSTINIFALAGQLVHIKLAPDEQIVTIQLADAIRWHVERVEEEGIGPRLFIKPTQVSIATTMTVVTFIPLTGGSRSYELLLQSVPEGGRFFRQVSFDYPDIRERESKARRQAQAKVIVEQERLASHELTAPLPIDTVNWKYTIDGKAPFKPDVVFDDGKFTYLRIPPSAQDWPAVFLLQGNTLQHVQVSRRGELLVVHRLVDSLLLKINEAEVKVHRAETKPRSWFGS